MTSQPTQSDEMRQARTVFVALAATLLLIGLAIGFFAAQLGPPVGDLTRIAGKSERAFGWQGEMQKFEADHFRKLPLVDLIARGTQGGIVVFGDSFTDAEEPGTSWLNTLYAQTGQPIDFVEYSTLTDVLDLLASAALQQSPPQTIILQMGERTVLRRALPIDIDDGCTVPPPLSRLDAAAQDLAQVAWTRRTAFDGFDELMSWGALALRRQIFASDKVVQVPLTTDTLFSSQAADQLLIYHSDILRHAPQALYPLSLEQAENRIICGIRHVMAQAGDIDIVLLVAPDKRSIYTDWFDATLPAKAIDIETTLRGQFGDRYVDVFDSLREDVREGRQDVYYPNDTHWNARTAQKVGQMVAKLISEVR